MLVKFLSTTDKAHLLDLANLLALSDNPLSWGGKSKDDGASETDLSKLSILKEERESALITELETEGAGVPEKAVASRGLTDSGFQLVSIEDMLIEKLKSFPLHKLDDPAIREGAAVSILKKLLEGKFYETSYVPKLMLYELMSMALCDGYISSIEQALLREFQNHHGLRDFVFEDLLVRAEAVNREVTKTIAFILE